MTYVRESATLGGREISIETGRMAKQASGSIIISSGTFSRDALRFAADKPIELVDGRQLVQLIGST